VFGLWIFLEEVDASDLSKKTRPELGVAGADIGGRGLKGSAADFGSISEDDVVQAVEVITRGTASNVDDVGDGAGTEDQTVDITNGIATGVATLKLAGVVAGESSGVAPWVHPHVAVSVNINANHQSALVRGGIVPEVGGFGGKPGAAAVIRVCAWVTGRTTSVPLELVVAVEVSANACGARVGLTILAPGGVAEGELAAIRVHEGQDVKFISINQVPNGGVGAVLGDQIFSHEGAEHGGKPFASVFAAEIEDDALVVAANGAGDGDALLGSAFKRATPDEGAHQIGKSAGQISQTGIDGSLALVGVIESIAGGGTLFARQIADLIVGGVNHPIGVSNGLLSDIGDIEAESGE